MVNDRTDAIPIWLVTLAVLISLARGSVMLYDREHPFMASQLINWVPAKDVNSIIFKNHKPAALYFVHSGKCHQCANMSQVVETPEVAKLMNEDYIPVKVEVPHQRKDESPEVKSLKQNYAGWAVPQLVVVPVECWDVPLENSYMLPDVRLVEMMPIDASEVKRLLERSKRWHAEPPSFGHVAWMKPSVALEKATDEKPALLFFGRSWDFHSDTVRAEIFGNANISKAINENFLPSFVVNMERKGIPNLPKTTELISRFRVKSFPSIVISSPSRPAQMMTGFAGEKETLEFLTHARGK